MKEYDVIVIGSCSAMTILSAIMQSDPAIRVTVIDRDEPTYAGAYATAKERYARVLRCIAFSQEYSAGSALRSAFQSSSQRRWLIQFIWQIFCGEGRILCGT